MPGVLIGRPCGDTGTRRATGRMPGDDESRDGKDAATN